MQYKGSNKGVDQIASELQVDYIVEGSVRRVADRVRVTAQLIAVADQTHLWTESYDCDLNDVLGIQSDVAARVRRSLATALLPAEVAKKHAFLPSIRPHTTLTCGVVITGRSVMKGGLKKAIECFERAIQQDPAFALSYSGLADSYALLSWYGELPPRKAGPVAKSAATKALELDKELGEAHASLGLIRFWYEWDWRGAETEFKNALELSPNYATAHQWFASYLVAMGRFDEASAELKRALELDPLSLIIVQSMGDPFFYGRQYDEAITHYHRTIELNSGFAPAHFSLGRAYVQKSMYKEAIAEFQKANAISGKMEAAPALAHALARMGARAEATRILYELILHSEKSYVPPLPIALIHLGLGQEQEAIEWIEKAFEERSCWLVYSMVDPVFDPIRRNPRFQSTLTMLRLKRTDLAAA
jgi:adenylate cyclase